jgi:hypothetical protein
MASKDETTDSQPADLDTAESYLLKLPPELRNRIFELVLSAAPKCYISELTRPHKPGLLQLNRQIRAETNLMYYALKHFTVHFTASTLSVVHNWVGTVTTAELRSIESVTFKFDLTYEGLESVFPPLNFHRSSAQPLTATLLHSDQETSDFVQLLWRLYEMGLARSAVRVFYVVSLSDDSDLARRFSESFLKYVVSLHDEDDRIEMELIILRKVT